MAPTRNIQDYWTNFKVDHKLPKDTPYFEAFSFGNSDTMADELADLVLTGRKRGTASAYELYQLDNDPLPPYGGYSIVLNSKDQPVCVIKNVKLEILPFGHVTEYHAKIEGEGDLSLDYWRQAHIAFFKPYFKEIGLDFSEETPVVFETFKVVL